MTLGEIRRAIKSKIRVHKLQAQEHASYDYVLAQLITKGVGKVLGDKGDYPTLEEVYPEIFKDIVEDRKAKAEARKMDLSALRFKQFANFHNNKYKEVAVDK